jgi:ribosomal protein S15P/S13E
MAGYGYQLYVNPASITGMYTDVGRLVNQTGKDLVESELGVAKFLQDKKLSDIRAEGEAIKLKEARLEQDRLDTPIGVRDISNLFGQQLPPDQLLSAVPPAIDNFTKSMGMTIGEDGAITKKDGGNLTIRDIKHMSGALAGLAVANIDPEALLADKKAKLEAHVKENPEDKSAANGLYKLTLSERELAKNPLPIYERKLRAMNTVLGQIMDWGGDPKIIEAERAKLLGQIDAQIKRNYDETQKLELKLPDGRTVLVAPAQWATVMGHLLDGEVKRLEIALKSREQKLKELEAGGITPEKIGELNRKVMADVDTDIKNRLDPAGRLPKPDGGFYTPAEIQAIKVEETNRRLDIINGQMRSAAESYGFGKKGRKLGPGPESKVSPADVENIKVSFKEVLSHLPQNPVKGSPEEALVAEKDAAVAKVNELLKQNKVTEAKTIVDGLKQKAVSLTASKKEQQKKDVKKGITESATSWLNGFSLGQGTAQIPTETTPMPGENFPVDLSPGEEGSWYDQLLKDSRSAQR